jgi:hypothetical protein
MKKITLLVTVIFLVENAVHAQVRSLTNNCENNLTINQPLAFNERGIDFFVFPNGEFDFNTEPISNTEIVYRKGRPNFNGNVGVIIEHDNQGRIRRIGNVFLNYDYQNRIKRIGSVYMRYNRYSLTQIGGMRLLYDRRGNLVNTRGFIKGNGIRYGYCVANTNDECDDYSSLYFRRST